MQFSYRVRQHSTRKNETYFKTTVKICLKGCLDLYNLFIIVVSKVSLRRRNDFTTKQSNPKVNKYVDFFNNKSASEWIQQEREVKKVNRPKEERNRPILL